MSTQNVSLSMPKFSFEYEPEKLPDKLMNMGMVDAFDPDTADFTGMAEEKRLFITDILQKAFVKVDEKGTEAAAATAVIIGEKAGPSDVVYMDINRPFIFFILDKETGTILFAGRIMDPSPE